MKKYNISREAKKALEKSKVEVSEGFDSQKKQLYDLKNNLTNSEDVTDQIIETSAKSRNNPNNSFSDFLGKGF